MLVFNAPVLFSLISFITSRIELFASSHISLRKDGDVSLQPMFFSSWLLEIILYNCPKFLYIFTILTPFIAHPYYPSTCSAKMSRRYPHHCTVAKINQCISPIRQKNNSRIILPPTASTCRRMPCQLWERDV